MRIENSISTNLEPIAPIMPEEPKMFKEDDLKKKEAFEQRAKQEFIQALEPYGKVIHAFGELGILAETKSGFRLQVKISAFHTSDDMLCRPSEAPILLRGYFLVPSGWFKRLKVENHFSCMSLKSFIAIWKDLIEESDTVLEPEPESTIYETEEAQHQLSAILNDFAILKEVCPSTVKTEETNAIAKELQVLLSQDPTLSYTPEGRSARLYTHLSGLTYRSFLVVYKDHYFVLADAGGSCWEYVSTVQEFILSLTGDTRFEL